MIELYVVRHGIAVGRESPMEDAFRPLTSKGRRRFRKTAKAFGRIARKLDVIFTSPLVRAVQTAEILAREAKHGEVAVLEELDPKVAVETLVEAIAIRANGSKAVALVGHEPQLSELVAALAGVGAEELDLKKGAIVRLDMDDPSETGTADPRWTLQPKSKSVDKGLPFARPPEPAGEEAAVREASGGDEPSDGSAASAAASEAESSPQPS
jgi:phosphohistidine phosphatase